MAQLNAWGTGYFAMGNLDPFSHDEPNYYMPGILKAPISLICPIACYALSSSAYSSTQLTLITFSATH